MLYSKPYPAPHSEKILTIGPIVIQQIVNDATRTKASLDFIWGREKAGSSIKKLNMRPPLPLRLGSNISTS